MPALPCASVEPGCKVRAVRLCGRADLNGRQGVVLDSATTDPQKWLVALEGPVAEELVLSAANLEVVDPSLFSKSAQTPPVPEKRGIAASARRGSLSFTTIACLVVLALAVGALGGAASLREEGVEFNLNFMSLPLPLFRCRFSMSLTSSP